MYEELQLTALIPVGAYILQIPAKKRLEFNKSKPTILPNPKFVDWISLNMNRQLFEFLSLSPVFLMSK